MLDFLNVILRSYAEVLFVRSRTLGLLLFIVLMVRPGMVLCGMVALIAAYAFARFIGMHRTFLGSGFYTYNPLLVGLFIGSVYQLGGVTLSFAASAGMMTFLLTAGLAHLFAVQLKLPILSLPFVIVSSLAYLATLRYSGMSPSTAVLPAWETADLGLPFWLAGYFKAFGAILFVPTVVAGLGIALLVLGSSRILFMLSVIGYFAGTLFRAVLLGSWSQAFADLSAFNFILIAMVVGGILLVPSTRSYLLAVVAVVVSAFLLDAISVFGAANSIPAFTLPFNVVSIGMLYVLGICGYPLINHGYGHTPEDTLDLYLSNQMRYRGDLRTLALPFAGGWTVWQAFDGRWTHKGNWRHAYDFVITDPAACTHRHDGHELTDYLCYRKPVLAPVRGRIIHVVNHLPDNPPGHYDKTNNWGNLVLIEDPRGFHVLLCHLSHESLKVREGDWVERGTILGLCGNSGYSPQPHLHVQVQLDNRIGAATVPFSFTGYVEGQTWHANDLPIEGTRVRALALDRTLDTVTTLVLDDELHFDVTRGGAPAPGLQLQVRMDLDGTFYLDSGRARLYFGKHEGTFYFYRLDGHDPCLRALFLALPRLPLAGGEGLVWTDYVPVSLVTRGPRAAMARFLGAFVPRLALVRIHLTRVGGTNVSALIEAPWLGLREQAWLELDAKRGFQRLTFGDLVLERRDLPEPSAANNPVMAQSALTVRNWKALDEKQ